MIHSAWKSETKTFICNLIRSSYQPTQQNNDSSDSIEIPLDEFDPEKMTELTLSSQSEVASVNPEQELQKLEAFCHRKFYKCKFLKLKFLVNGGASFRWSFCPLCAWGSIESTTILTKHPSLS